MTIVVDRKLSNIKIMGLSKAVHEMAEVTSSELRSLEKVAHDKVEEILIAKAIQWMYKDGNDGWKKFDSATNKVTNLQWTIP